MLAGHIDEIGFLIHHIGEDGLLHFSGIGSHDDVTSVGQRVWVHGKKRIAGVVGSRAFHLLSPDEKTKRPEIKKLWIDIGAKSRKEAEELVSLGDPITYTETFSPLLDERATARGFDNTAGAVIVAEALRLLQQDGGLHRKVGVYAVATVQEEIGSRGAEVATYSVNPVTGIVVDMDHATDLPPLDERQFGSLHVGKGPTIGRGPNVNPLVYDLLTEAAREEGIPYQVSVFAAATPTDANMMQVSRSGVATGLVGVPLRYMHTPSETLSLTDVENCARLVAAYCRRITPETDFRPRLSQS
ncbi:M20/M25/M40 family metallo-hydrolase [Micromonospora sp. STR1s_5]|nr:M20/M25/M40 family metallo-hydrolase [Micromonospora sp. STR1s_5]